MKIAYILAEFPCLSETFAAREIENLRQSGMEITVFAGKGQSYHAKLSEAIAVLYKPALLSLCAIRAIAYMVVRYPLALVKLTTLIAKLIKYCPREAITLIGNLHTISFFAQYIDRYNISHLHAYFLNWPACITMALAKITNRPFSIAAHARDIFVEPGALELKVSHATFVVTCTRQGMNYLKTNLPQQHHNKLHLNYHGININSRTLNQPTYQPQTNNTVVAVGRLVAKKGFANLLRAHALLLKRGLHCSLALVGDGPDRDTLSLLVERLKLKQSAHILGSQDYDMTLRLIRQAGILVVPSIIANDGDRDGIPNVIIEAFAENTAVIASSLDGIAEVVKHEQTGLLVKPGDVKELAGAIQRLLCDEELRCHLSVKAQQLLKQNFDAVENTKQLIKLFKNQH